MSTPTTTPPHGGPSVGRSRALNGTLSLRPRGLWLVTSLELRQRLRSVRWYVALVVWTLVLLAIGALGLAPTLYTAQWEGLEPVAAMIFSLQIVLVLFAMLLVVPALSAGSINGDRSAGTLATLQASLLSPWRSCWASCWPDSSPASSSCSSRCPRWCRSRSSEASGRCTSCAPWW